MLKRKIFSSFSFYIRMIRLTLLSLIFIFGSYDSIRWGEKGAVSKHININTNLVRVWPPDRFITDCWTYLKQEIKITQDLLTFHPAQDTCVFVISFCCFSFCFFFFLILLFQIRPENSINIVVIFSRGLSIQYYNENTRDKR